MNTKLGYLLQVVNDGVVRLDLGAYASLALDTAQDEAQAWFDEDEGNDEGPRLEWVEQLDRAPGEPQVWTAQFGVSDFPAWYVITSCSVEV